MTRTRHCTCLLFTLLVVHAAVSQAEDWPMWRHDPSRSAITTESLPEKLHLQWTRTYPRVQPAFRTRRLQFDLGYEPVVMNRTLFMGSSVNDSASALDAETGAHQWTFYTDGPVRFAPVAWQGRVFVGSDDGCLYCLNATTGGLIWRFRAVPSDRKIMGNGRLMSVWPIRGGAVLKDGRIYFAAGMWPFEGIFLYALDAATGKVVWRNDRCGSLYLGHPHGAWSFGGPSLQGYLVINGKDLLVPNGTGGVPAYFDRRTGALQAFAHLANRIPGSWFVTADPNGRLRVDSSYNRELHEDRFYETRWSNRNAWTRLPTADTWTTRTWLARAGSRRMIAVGGRRLSFDDGFEGVTGQVCSMLVAHHRLFIVTDGGCLYCYGANITTPQRHPYTPSSLDTPADDWQARVRHMVKTSGKRHGYALVWGVGTGRLAEELTLQTDMRVIAVDPDADKVERLRRRWDAAGLYGKRVVLHKGDPMDFGFPPYLADLVASEDLHAAGVSRQRAFVERIFASLRPYGGLACLFLPRSQLEAFAGWVRQADLAHAQFKQQDGLALLTRAGALPGTSNYTGQWTSPDALVKAPLGVLWFDDAIRQFKRSPQPDIVDGVMISQPKAWLTTQRPYTLESPSFADVYTGRVLSTAEARETLKTLPPRDSSAQPAQYRPPVVHEDQVWGERINPITGLTEPRVLPKSYGCEPGVDYGHMITMRSGTGAFYDKRIESGLVNITGIRSGCTNSIIPACGVLNVPYFYEGCTCGYPLNSGLGMVHMPEAFEQWMAWGNSEFTGRIKRLGINFGAPGDRMTESGTLWLDYPSVGGPSPEIAMKVSPEVVVSNYRHALWIKGGDGLPWVSASNLEGVEHIRLSLLPEQYQGIDANDVLPYTVRLFFAELAEMRPGQRVFSVSLQGREVLSDFDIVSAAGGILRGVVREFRGVKAARTLELRFTAKSGRPVLSGIELLIESRFTHALVF